MPKGMPKIGHEPDHAHHTRGEAPPLASVDRRNSSENGGADSLDVGTVPDSVCPRGPNAPLPRMGGKVVPQRLPDFRHVSCYMGGHRGYH